eukprot:1329205-Amorphochlora_amoeboformis.AAC.3
MAPDGRHTARALRRPGARGISLTCGVCLIFGSILLTFCDPKPLGSRVSVQRRVEVCARKSGKVPEFNDPRFLDAVGKVREGLGSVHVCRMLRL